MQKLVFRLCLIASVVAIAYAFPSAEEHHPAELAHAEGSSGDLSDSFGSLAHHGTAESKGVAAGDDSLTRDARFIKIGFGGYGGYGGYGFRRRRFYGGYGGYGGGYRRYGGYGFYG